MRYGGHDPDECDEETRAGALMLAEGLALHIAFIKGLSGALSGEPSGKGQPSKIRRTFKRS